MIKRPHVTVCVPTTEERISSGKLQVCLDAINKSDYPDFSVFPHTSNNKGCNGNMQEMFTKVEGMVFFLNDDMIIEPETISRLVDALPDESYVAGPENQFQGDTLVTAPLCHIDVLRKYWSDAYIHNFVDNEFTNKVKDKFIYVPEARLDHRHVTVDRSRQDETYKINQETFEQDSRTYHERNK